MMLYKLLWALDREEYDPVVISLLDKGTLGNRIEALGVPVLELNLQRRGMSMLLGVVQSAASMRSVRGHIVQGWMYHGNLAASLWGASFRRKGAKVVWNIRHTPCDLKDERPLTQLVIRTGCLLSKKVDSIIYNSRASQEYHTKLGYSGKRSLVLPNGFDCEQFKPDLAARDRLRGALGIDDDTVLIGLIARYHPMKDHRTFLEAASLVSQRRRNVAFVLVGEGADSFNGEIVLRLRRLGIQEKTHLLGERNDVAGILPALDISSSTSAWGEGFSNVVGESMACGVPCVVTDVGDSGWIVQDTGVVVPPRNPGAMAEGWEQIIRLGVEGRAELGWKARKRIEDRFSLVSVAKDYEALYRRIHGDEKTPSSAGRS